MLLLVLLTYLLMSQTSERTLVQVRRSLFNSVYVYFSVYLKYFLGVLKFLNMTSHYWASIFIKLELL